MLAARDSLPSDLGEPDLLGTSVAVPNVSERRSPKLHLLKGVLSELDGDAVEFENRHGLGEVIPPLHLAEGNPPALSFRLEAELGEKCP